MLFHSITFICIFLPIGLAGYYFLGSKGNAGARWWLLLTSCLFYFLGSRANLFLLLLSICLNFILGSFLEKYSDQKYRKIILIIGIVINLGILIFYKSFSLFELTSVTNYKTVFTDSFVPLGLSFFSLQQVAYLIDLYRKNIFKESFLNYALFVGFFPQLIAGPIVRFQEIVPQLKNPQTYVFRYDNFVIGSTIFILGASKKIICANRAGIVANGIFNGVSQGAIPTLVEAWIGAFAFTLQLYFDFSSYSDMAVGVARMFGIRLPINFNSPFRARGVMEGFTRWHITLYRYFSDYLVRPLFSLLIKIPLQKKIAKTRFAVSISTFAMLVLSGLWHGFSFNFFLWGVLNAIVAVGFYLWKEYTRGTGIKINPSHPLLARVKSCLFIAGLLCIGVCFKAQSVEEIRTIILSMMGVNGISLSPKLYDSLGAINSTLISFDGFFPNGLVPGGLNGCVRLLIIPIVIIFFMPNVYEFLYHYGPALGTERLLKLNKKINWIPNKTWAFFMALVSIMTIFYSFNSAYSISIFEYFRF